MTPATRLLYNIVGTDVAKNNVLFNTGSHFSIKN